MQRYAGGSQANNLLVPQYESARGPADACADFLQQVYTASAISPNLQMRERHDADPEPIHPDRRPIKVFRCFRFVIFLLCVALAWSVFEFLHFSYHGHDVYINVVNPGPFSLTFGKESKIRLKTGFPFRDIGGVTIFPGLRQARLRQGPSVGHTCAKHS